MTDKEIATSKEDILKQLRNLSSDLFLSGIDLQEYLKTPDIPNRIFLDDMSLRFRYMSARLTSDNVEDGIVTWAKIGDSSSPLEKA